VLQCSFSSLSSTPSFSSPLLPLALHSSLHDALPIFRRKNHQTSLAGKIQWFETQHAADALHSVLHRYVFRMETDAHLALSRNLRSEEHTSELQSRFDLVCRLLLAKKKKETRTYQCT